MFQVKSLRKIVTALTLSLLPVMNVFLILFLLMSICAGRPAQRHARTHARTHTRLRDGRAAQTRAHRPARMPSARA